ncbi:hypothetical protein NC651_031249 [Populus alba x Populus x berolinensis]|nr:hypothetical protein NC651_031249 [Populus alba x Populus x berolinensis]
MVFPPNTKTYGREHLEAVCRQDFNRDDSPKVSPVVAIGSPSKACAVVGEVFCDEQTWALWKGMKQEVVDEIRVGATIQGHSFESKKFSKVVHACLLSPIEKGYYGRDEVSANALVVN